MDYSRKNPNSGGWGYIFLKNPLEYSFFYYTPGNSRQKKAQPLDNPQNCVRSLGNSKAKNNDPWKFHTFFITFGNSTSFLFNPWKLHILFLWYPWKFHILNPPVWNFSGIAQLFLISTSGSFLLFINNLLLLTRHVIP